MYYVYLLKSDKTGKFYVGQTNDLRNRFLEHNKGLSKSTKSGAPWSLVYYEAFQSKSALIKREKALKHHGQAIAALKKRVLD